MTKDFEVINLDIGGKKFSTYYDTLKMSTYFQDLIEKKEGEQAINIGTMDEPTYFIDRDGGVFEEIMQYLRSYSIRKKGQEDLKKMKVEATFFKFDALVEEIDRTMAEADDEATFYIGDTSEGVKYIAANDDTTLAIDTKTSIVSKISYTGPNGTDQHSFIQKASKQR